MENLIVLKANIVEATLLNIYGVWKLLLWNFIETPCYIEMDAISKTALSTCSIFETFFKKTWPPERNQVDLVIPLFCFEGEAWWKADRNNAKQDTRKSYISCKFLQY